MDGWAFTRQSWVVSGCAVTGCVAKKIERPNCTGLAAHVNYSALNPQGLVDEQDQPNHIPFGQPPHLAFPDHVHDFVALNGSLGSVEGAEPLTRVDPSLDGAVALLHDVVQVRTGATATPPA